MRNRRPSAITTFAAGDRKQSSIILSRVRSSWGSTKIDRPKRNEPLDVIPGCTISGDMISGDMISGDMISGDMISGDMISGDTIAGG